MFFSCQIVNGGLIPSLVRESVRRAEEERPGAVHLELPEDIAGMPVSTHIEMRLKQPEILDRVCWVLYHIDTTRSSCLHLSA